MSNSSSPKSNKSGSSTRSDLSTLSADSWKYTSKLTDAISKLLDEQGIFEVRKQVSHDAKKLTTTLDKNIGFEHGGSPKMQADYKAYKDEVKKILPLKNAYKNASDAAFESFDPKLHEDAIKAANAWLAQAVNAGNLRIRFLNTHKEELKEHLTIKSTTDHIHQAQANLKSANEAAIRVGKHEKALADLARKLAAESARGK